MNLSIPSIKLHPLLVRCRRRHPSATDPRCHRRRLTLARGAQLITARFRNGIDRIGLEAVVAYEAIASGRFLWVDGLQRDRYRFERQIAAPRLGGGGGVEVGHGLEDGAGLGDAGREGDHHVGVLLVVRLDILQKAESLIEVPGGSPGGSASGDGPWDLALEF